MTRVVRWGVAGSGGIAMRRTIPEGIAPASNAQLTSLYDISTEANQAVADRFGAVACKSLDALLATDIDAVYIATPVHCHMEQALECFRAGKHVLCEKPFGLTVEEAETMAEAAHSAGRLLGIGFMMRFQAQHTEAARRIREGRIGRPVFARAQLSCWYPPIEGAWRQDPALAGGGSLTDMGAHLIDLLEMFFGSITRVSCFTRNTVHAYSSEDSAVGLLEFENGAVGTIDAFFSIPDAASRNALELYGSQGAILAANTIGQGECGEMAMVAGTGAASYLAIQDRTAAGGEPIAPAPVNTYRAEIESFGRAVLEGGEPEAGIREGLHAQRVLAACYKSAASGRAVTVA